MAEAADKTSESGSLSSPHSIPSMSEFKRMQVRYKRRPNEPDHVDDLHEMVDFLHPARDERIVTLESRTAVAPPSICGSNSGRPIYGLAAYPGFCYMPSALSSELQRGLAWAAVTSYCEAPHRTNIDGVPPKPHEVVNKYDNSNNNSMWELWKAEQSVLTASKTSSSTPTPQPLPILESKRYYRNFGKLTWATLGYHYDWTARAYHRNMKSPMPAELQRLGQLFAEFAASHCEGRDGNGATINGNNNNTKLSVSSHSPPLHVTAAIVNFYHAKSVMGGHRDDLEEALTQPIVSLSLGRPAVFLLGGTTIMDSSNNHSSSSTNEPVIPIIVRPGDVMVMGGACRLNYHSMARLLPSTVAKTGAGTYSYGENAEIPSHCQVQLRDVLDVAAHDNDMVNPSTPADLDALTMFLEHHRININLRQVYNSEPPST